MISNTLNTVSVTAIWDYHEHPLAITEVPILRKILLRRVISSLTYGKHGDAHTGVSKRTAGKSHDTIRPKGPTTYKLAGGYACIVQGGISGSGRALSVSGAECPEYRTHNVTIVSALVTAQVVEVIWGGSSPPPVRASEHCPKAK